MQETDSNTKHKTEQGMQIAESNTCNMRKIINQTTHYSKHTRLSLRHRTNGFDQILQKKETKKSKKQAIKTQNEMHTQFTNK